MISSEEPATTERGSMQKRGLSSGYASAIAMLVAIAIGVFMYASNHGTTRVAAGVVVVVALAALLLALRNLQKQGRGLVA